MIWNLAHKKKYKKICFVFTGLVVRTSDMLCFFYESRAILNHHKIAAKRVLERLAYPVPLQQIDKQTIATTNITKLLGPHIFTSPNRLKYKWLQVTKHARISFLHGELRQLSNHPICYGPFSGFSDSILMKCWSRKQRWKGKYLRSSMPQ